jgi:hypothetical protein
LSGTEQGLNRVRHCCALARSHIAEAFAAFIDDANPRVLVLTGTPSYSRQTPRAERGAARFVQIAISFGNTARLCITTADASHGTRVA